MDFYYGNPGSTPPENYINPRGVEKGNVASPNKINLDYR